MKVNRLISIAAGATLSSIGLLTGLAVGWLPAFILSMIGMGSLFHFLMAILGLSAGFLIYVKASKYFNCWPMYSPPPSSIQQMLNLVRSVPQESLYEDAKTAIRKIEAELALQYQHGWKNFKVEFTNETSDLSHSATNTLLRPLHDLLPQSPEEGVATSTVLTKISNWTSSKRKHS
ncbi:hypothetical protein CC99x_008650 [Candidatus Berkiella cookevillensis]|uniref:Uncharacterized protein n=1 Tax=Candidatus Berkiella cookevillensis TaxID=437022 RepID=A0A0Q9YFJ4_9GAMM|nr:hypothetical protein [Candidatus Berkiella cookevillensis]MCS5708969.1 hypothetical protein [Candidatus Berkiella cookevillensis]